MIFPRSLIAFLRTLRHPCKANDRAVDRMVREALNTSYNDYGYARKDTHQ